MSAPSSSGQGLESYRPPPIGGPTSDGEGLSIRAIAIGVAVDWLGTVGATFAVVVLVSAVMAARHGLDAGVEEQVEMIVRTRDFALLMAFIGTAFVAIGGYFTGIVAGRDEIRHAAVMGMVSIVLGAATQLLPIEREPVWNPVWFQVLSIAAVLPAAMFGGFLAERARLRRASPRY